MASYIVVLWLVIVSSACITSIFWYERKLNQVQKLVQNAEADLINDFRQIDLSELSKTPSGQELLDLLSKEHSQVLEKLTSQEAHAEKNINNILAKLKREQLQLQQEMDAINKFADESRKKWLQMQLQQLQSDLDKYSAQGDEKRIQ